MSDFDVFFPMPENRRNADDMGMPQQQMSDDDLIERVARAICGTIADDGGQHFDIWDNASERVRNDYRQEARAAIAEAWPAKLSPCVIAACVGGGVTTEQINKIYFLLRAALADKTT